MTALIKNNKPMLLTIISGLLIIVGGMLSYNNQQPLDAFVYVTAFLIGGYFQARVGFSDLLFKKKLNVDILMVLAAIGASVIGYWLEGALLIFIFSLSGSLEVYTTNKSTDAISKLMELTPETALLLSEDGSTEEVATKDLKVGNKLLVPKGSAFPIDGILLSEYALVDEAAISGESMAVNKAMKDEVIGGTINVSRAVAIEVKAEYSDTLFAKIIRMVDEAQGTPSKTATFIESIETRYVKIVLIFVPVMMLIFYYALGWGFNESFYRGMVLLTVASPCALMASASPATLSAISNGAKKGVLYKGGSFLENFGQIDAIAFDKTGTLTQGSPKVTDVNYLKEINQETVVQVIVQLERISSHPLAQAVIDHLNASEMKHDIKVTEINEVEGHGVEGYVDEDHWKIGKKEFTVKDDTSAFALSANEKQTEGKTVLYVTKNDQLMSFIALLDLPAPGAKEMIDYFKSQGIYTILITGDNEATGQAIGKTVGVDEVKANCLPVEKATLILDLKEKYETIVMVGDGINDAPALANASIGIAMGAGTDLAMDAADVVLVKNELEQLTYSHKLSKRLNRIIMQNVVFSISVILFLIVVNVLQLINLPLGVIGHEGSTILVILNGLRLLRPIK
ncbi:heavy metal translocating P-type ATPase [Alkalibacterium sp. f15]|uniref:heavy metal translocating P-type ATPase n=1 Tax=Alkalibacterium sp. f15 TaxID=3414029 RepID=UPI003BF8FEE5